MPECCASSMEDGTTPRVRGKAAVPLMSTPYKGTTPRVRGTEGARLVRLQYRRINPARAGKRLHAQQVCLTTIQFSLNCVFYPTLTHTAAATVKPTRPFSTVVCEDQLASELSGLTHCLRCGLLHRPLPRSPLLPRLVPFYVPCTAGFVSPLGDCGRCCWGGWWHCYGQLVPLRDC